MENILPNLLEFIPMFIAFCVLFFILSKFAWPMISKNLEARQENIANNLEQAEAAKIEGERLLNDYKAQVAAARGDVAKIMEEGQAAAAAMREELIAKAEQEAAAIKARAVEEIETEKRAAMAELQGSVADISVAVAGKLIGEKLTVESNAALIDRFVAEVGGLNDN